MELLDPATGQALPNDAIQRILFLCNTVHVYNIPPMPSNRGYVASTWTDDPSKQIFTARIRVIETSYETPSSSSSSSTAAESTSSESESSVAAAAAAQTTSNLKVDIILQDPKTGQLFAAAPYATPAVLDPVIDSSRFFALTVRDPSGKRAVLGIGFEDRSEAFDLGVALQEARRSLGWEGGRQGGGDGLGGAGSKAASEEAKDYSLKEGETITVNLGGSKWGRRVSQSRKEGEAGSESGTGADLQSFALPPPPGGGGGGIAPPPGVKKERRKSARDLGFNDGQFGEFA